MAPIGAINYARGSRAGSGLGLQVKSKSSAFNLGATFQLFFERLHFLKKNCKKKVSLWEGDLLRVFFKEEKSGIPFGAQQNVTCNNWYLHPTPPPLRAPQLIGLLAPGSMGKFDLENFCDFFLGKMDPPPSLKAPPP